VREDNKPLRGVLLFFVGKILIRAIAPASAWWALHYSLLCRKTSALAVAFPFFLLPVFSLSFFTSPLFCVFFYRFVMKGVQIGGPTEGTFPAISKHFGESLPKLIVLQGMVILVILFSNRNQPELSYQSETMLPLNGNTFKTLIHHSFELDLSTQRLT